MPNRGFFRGWMFALWYRSAFFWAFLTDRNHGVGGEFWFRSLSASEGEGLRSSYCVIRSYSCTVRLTGVARGDSCQVDKACIGHEIWMRAGKRNRKLDRRSVENLGTYCLSGVYLPTFICPNLFLRKFVRPRLIFGMDDWRIALQLLAIDLVGTGETLT